MPSCRVNVLLFLVTPWILIVLAAFVPLIDKRFPYTQLVSEESERQPTCAYLCTLYSLTKSIRTWVSRAETSLDITFVIQRRKGRILYVKPPSSILSMVSTCKAQISRPNSLLSMTLYRFLHLGSTHPWTNSGRDRGRDGRMVH